MGEPVKKPILGVGRFTGLNREYSVEYSIDSATANERLSLRLGFNGNILGNILRRGWRRGLRLGWDRLNGSHMARVDGTRLLPLARVGATGLQFPDLQVARVGYLSLRSS